MSIRLANGNLVTKDLGDKIPMTKVISDNFAEQKASMVVLGAPIKMCSFFGGELMPKKMIEMMEEVEFKFLTDLASQRRTSVMEVDASLNQAAKRLKPGVAPRVLQRRASSR